MNLGRYLGAVPTWSADEVRHFLVEAQPGSYNLIDVRQPEEYERGHLPGAQLVPLKNLQERLAELDAGLPTITYCAAGVRSRTAAAVLVRAGFPRIHSMEGGMNAWSGQVADGPPQAGMDLLPPEAEPGELIALAWVLEDGSRRFYDGLAQQLTRPEDASFLRSLAFNEADHQILLEGLSKEVLTAEQAEGFPGSCLQGPPQRPIMEGGMDVAEALEWSRGRMLKYALQLALAQEANSHDLHLRTAERAPGPEARDVFRRLAHEEKLHLQKMSLHLDELL